MYRTVRARAWAPLGYLHGLGGPLLLLLAVSWGCKGFDESKTLSCSSGEFTLAGQPFTTCSQCPDPATCSFDTQISNSYDSSGRTTGGSGTDTARCQGQSATISFDVTAGGIRTNEHCSGTSSGSTSSPSSTCKITGLELQVPPIPVNGTIQAIATTTTSCGEPINDGKTMFGLIGSEATGSTLSAPESRPTLGVPGNIDVPIREGKAAVSITGGGIPGYVRVHAFAVWSRTTTASAGDVMDVAVYDQPCFPATATLKLENSIPSSGAAQASFSLTVLPALPSQCPQGVADGTPVAVEIQDSSGYLPDKTGATADPPETVTKAGAARFTVRAGTTTGTVTVNAIVNTGLRADGVSVRLVPATAPDAGPDATPRLVPDAPRASAPDAPASSNHAVDGGMDASATEPDAVTQEAQQP